MAQIVVKPGYNLPNGIRYASLHGEKYAGEALTTITILDECMTKEMKSLSVGVQSGAVYNKKVRVVSQELVLDLD